MKKFRGEEVEDHSGPIYRLQWEADYYLTPIPRHALFYEYLEMGRFPVILDSPPRATPFKYYLDYL